MSRYDVLSEITEKRIKDDIANNTLPRFGFDDAKAVRRDNGRDIPSVWRPAFVRDIDKIMHCPFYNRYTDKTQVFSLTKNDDISRRALHVQLVSRIARTIGKTLNLNLELIEAIALGHDIGHTPFGHAGERFLDELYSDRTGRHFSHNIHSVRVLDKIFPYNITLQTLDGIAAHNGELECIEYRPRPLESFEEFDELIESCYQDNNNIKKLVPSTLEGCVVRISDIIAYLGKDRQDAERAGIIEGNEDFENGKIGKHNAEFINNLSVNIIENSYGKDYIKLDEEYFTALSEAKKQNYDLIYKDKKVKQALENIIRPMMGEIYERLLDDLLRGKRDSPVFSHHISYVNKAHYKRKEPYENSAPDTIVADYIASMTDDYFIDLHSYLFPESNLKIDYVGYF